MNHVNEQTKLLAFHRWDRGGPGDDEVVMANFENQPRGNYAIGFPRPGLWRLRLNSDWRGYSEDFSDFASRDVTSTAQDYDGYAARGQRGDWTVQTIDLVTGSLSGTLPKSRRARAW